MLRTPGTRLVLLTVGLLLATAACAPIRRAWERVGTQPAAPPAQPAQPEFPEPPPGGPPEPTPTVRAAPPVFESRDFIVTLARDGDSAERLAERHLGDAAKAWMIEDYAGARTFPEDQEVVIPKRDWNPVGVFPWGYQLVPVLVYHGIGPEQVGRLMIAARSFEAQMRHLHAEGFRTVSIRNLLDFTAGRRQVPRKSIILAFDDGYRSFLHYARPLLKELGFSATLFVYTDFVGAGRNSLSWPELRTLLAEGFDVQAHSKTHGKLRRREGESEAEYATRMEAELGQPLVLFRKHLGRASETLAYPYGEANDELLRHVVQHGYVAAFTVRRQANPAFVFPLQMHRSQIHAEMTLEEFARNLTVFQDVNLQRRAAGPTDPALSPATPAAGVAAPAAWSWERLAALHNEQAETLAHRGFLRQALEQRQIALTIDPRDSRAEEAVNRLEARIAREVAGLIEEGQALIGRGLLGQAQERLLAALALDPTNRPAFETLQQDVREVTFIVHTVRAGDTLASLAELYYGDRFRAEVIAETNQLPLNARLGPGRTLRIPEIPGVPILPH